MTSSRDKRRKRSHHAREECRIRTPRCVALEDWAVSGDSSGQPTTLHLARSVLLKSASEMSFRTLSEETETLAACEVPRTEMLQNKKTASVSGGPKPFVCVGRSSEKVTEWSNGPRFAMPGN